MVHTALVRIPGRPKPIPEWQFITTEGEQATVKQSVAHGIRAGTPGHVKTNSIRRQFLIRRQLVGGWDCPVQALLEIAFYTNTCLASGAG